MSARRTQSQRSQWRLRVTMLVIIFIVTVFGTRLMQLQGLDPQAYAAKAAASGVVSVPLPAKRGQILDRTGKALADSIDGRMLIADPLATKPYAGAIAGVLSKELGLDYFDVLARLSKPNSRYQYLARRVPSTQADAAIAAVKATVKALIQDPKRKAMPFGGVYSQPDVLRTYPTKDVASNIVGFLKDDGTPAAGLELAFNSRLAGHDGAETYEVGSGHRIPLGENSTKAPVDGEDLRLTIDSDLNWYAARVLRTAVQSSGSESGSVVVMNSKTGEVLALADYPSFDGNNPGKTKAADLGSRAISDVYEPGSVEKVLTVSALLDQKLVTPRTKLKVPPTLPVQDRVIHDWFPHDTIRLTLAGVIARSSNIGTAMAASQMPAHQLHDYLSAFGLGQRTNIGLGGESRGILPDYRSWQPVNEATIAFGQGVSVNAVQMAAAVNTIANKGEYVSPSLIQGTATTASGDKVGTDTSTRHRVISPAAADQMSRMMEMVPNPVTGTAPKAQVTGYRVAGKTGTAQRVGAHCGCYDGTFTVSFAGFAPADDPAFTVYVVVQNPRNGGGGGSIGGPAFSKIMRYLLSRYAVAPTNTKPAHLPIQW